MKNGQKIVTLRAFTIGLGLTIIVNAWITYSEYISHSSRMNLSQFPLALFAAFTLVVVLNVFVKALEQRWALSSSEMLFILSMGMAAAVIPTAGVAGFLLGVIATPYYFASPENHWAEIFHQYLPSWIAPRDEGNAMRWFFDGLPRGESVPWEVWVAPLFWWLSLAAVVAFVCACMMVILRKQWVHHERLVFPLLSPVLEMTRNSGGNAPGFLRRKLFWIGFAISFGILAWNMTSYFYPLVPKIPVGGRYIQIARGFPRIDTRINFFTLGFAYFANLDVLFSVWFFHLLYIFEIGILNRIGFQMQGHDNFCSMDPTSSWQGFGALTFMVFWGLWMARRHFKGVMLRAIGSPKGEDDSDEMLSYRTAVLGLIVGGIYILVWFYRSGMEVRMILLYIFGTFVICVGMARIVSQAGILYVREPLSAQVFAIYVLGTTNISAQSMTAIAMSFSLITLGRGLFLPSLAQVTKLSDSAIGKKKRILLCVFIALAIGTVTSLGLSILWGYEHGAYHFQSWPFSGGSKSVFYHTQAKMSNPADVDLQKIGVLVSGAVVMAVLTLLHYRFTWWPLHPIGLPICGTDVVWHSALAVCIAWMCKLIILKTGGAALYEKSKLFFLGILIGYAAGVFISFMIDIIWFPGNGHCLHSY